MSQILLDTNLLLRMHDPTSSDQLLAEEAVVKLRLRGNLPCITGQNLIEFWSVATRPRNVNGFNWATQRTKTEIKLLLNSFFLTT